MCAGRVSFASFGSFCLRGFVGESMSGLDGFCSLGTVANACGALTKSLQAVGHWKKGRWVSRRPHTRLKMGVDIALEALATKERYEFPPGPHLRLL